VLHEALKLKQPSIQICQNTSRRTFAFETLSINEIQGTEKLRPKVVRLKIVYIFYIINRDVENRLDVSDLHLSQPTASEMKIR